MVDVAFISISKIIRDVEIVAKKGADIVLLYKPQFEAGRQNISKNGLVKKGTDTKTLFSNFVNSFDKSCLNFVESSKAYITGKK